MRGVDIYDRKHTVWKPCLEIYGQLGDTLIKGYALDLARLMVKKGVIK